MKKCDLQNVGKVTIAGKTKILYSHRYLDWYRYGGCHIIAKTREEAIEKLRECAARKGKGNG